jgi:hypothetical protein
MRIVLSLLLGLFTLCGLAGSSLADDQSFETDGQQRLLEIKTA